MDSLEELLLHAGLQLESEPARGLRAFLVLLEKWNARVNLTASTGWKSVGPLLEEAVWAARLYPHEAVTHLDIGSGAGFPAIPLRILIPRMQLDLVESRTKRCMFLETAIGELGLGRTRVVHGRLDAFLVAENHSWDCISWKGLKLRTQDLLRLTDRSGAHTSFWMFHGREPAVEDAEALKRMLSLERREACPARKGWWLSEYRKTGTQDVSRETCPEGIS